MFKRVDEFIEPCQVNAAGKIKEILGTQYDHYLSSTLTTLQSGKVQNERLCLSKKLMKYNIDMNQKGKLTFLTNTTVIYVEFNSNLKAVGVKVRNDKTNEIYSINIEGDGEIILSAGVFNSPRILLNSIYQHLRLNTLTESNPIAGMSSEPNKSLLDTIFDKRFYSHIGNHFQDHITLPYMFMGNWNKLSTGNTMYKILYKLHYHSYMIITKWNRVNRCDKHRKRAV